MNDKVFVFPKEWDKPKFLDESSLDYLTVMGSRAYGTNVESSDYDFYGFTVPPLNIIFPHLNGYIQGFGRTYTPFEQYQAQHVKHPEYGEIDITIYNIVKYFQLVMLGNPNMVDSIFTHDEEVVHSSHIARAVREYRHLFLSEKMYHSFKGMAFSHLSRLKSGSVKQGRVENQQKYGYDTKDAYHAIRILLQIRDALKTGDMNLKQYRYLLLDIRNGSHEVEEVLEYAESLLKELDEIVKLGSAVPHSPDEKRLKELLVWCIESAHGDLKFTGFNKGK